MCHPTLELLPLPPPGAMEASDHQGAVRAVTRALQDTWSSPVQGMHCMQGSPAHGGSAGHPQHHPWWRRMGSDAESGWHFAQRGGRSFQKVLSSALATEPERLGQGRVHQSSLRGRMGFVPLSTSSCDSPSEDPFAECKCR